MFCWPGGPCIHHLGSEALFGSFFLSIPITARPWQVVLPPSISVNTWPTWATLNVVHCGPRSTLMLGGSTTCQGHTVMGMLRRKLPNKT